MPEQIDAQAAPSSALEGAIASSPEVQEEAQQAPETQTPPAQQGDNQEQTEQQESENVPFHKHPRFQELIEENRWLKQNMETIIQQRQAQQQFQQPNSDPYAGMTPEEEKFHRMIDEKIKQTASRIVDSKMQSINPMLEAGAKEIAAIKVQEFRKAHPNIKSGSVEEYEIAKRISEATRFGYSLSSDEAYWAVMGPKGVKVAREEGKQQIKQQIEAKKRANVESASSIPAQAQSAPKRTMRETMGYFWDLDQQGKL